MTLTYIIIGLVLTAVAVGVGILIWKIKKKDKFDYITKHGIKLNLSPQSYFLTKEVAEEWTESLIYFWNDKEGWDKKTIIKAVSDVKISLYDKLYLNRYGIKVNGVTFGNDIEIATMPKPGTYKIYDKVKSLFRHEMSHVIVSYMGIPIDQEIQHKLFDKDGLGA